MEFEEEYEGIGNVDEYLIEVFENHEDILGINEILLRLKFIETYKDDINAISSKNNSNRSYSDNISNKILANILNSFDNTIYDKLSKTQKRNYDIFFVESLMMKKRLKNDEYIKDCIKDYIEDIGDDVIPLSILMNISTNLNDKDGSKWAEIRALIGEKIKSLSTDEAYVLMQSTKSFNTLKYPEYNNAFAEKISDFSDIQYMQIWMGFMDGFIPKDTASFEAFDKRSKKMENLRTVFWGYNSTTSQDALELLKNAKTFEKLGYFNLYFRKMNGNETLEEKNLVRNEILKLNKDEYVKMMLNFCNSVIQIPKDGITEMFKGGMDKLSVDECFAFYNYVEERYGDDSVKKVVLDELVKRKKVDKTTLYKNGEEIINYDTEYNCNTKSCLRSYMHFEYLDKSSFSETDILRTSYPVIREPRNYEELLVYRDSFEEWEDALDENIKRCETLVGSKMYMDNLNDIEFVKILPRVNRRQDANSNIKSLNGYIRNRIISLRDERAKLLLGVCYDESNQELPFNKDIKEFIENNEMQPSVDDSIPIQ